jgi:hypothetical protein
VQISTGHTTVSARLYVNDLRDARVVRLAVRYTGHAPTRVGYLEYTCR